MGILYRPTYPPAGKTWKQAKAEGCLTPSRVWWVKYYAGGRVVRESTAETHEGRARRFLKLREGAVATGAPIPPRFDRILYDELRADLWTHYETTGKRRLEEVEDRLAYLDRFFRGRRAATITRPLITTYVSQRQGERIVRRARQKDARLAETVTDRRPSNRTLNIELAVLKRMLRLGAENGKLLRVPPIEMLKEAPPREGFFEDAQYEAVRRHLAHDLQVAVTIAHTYGWRCESEVLTLERRHVDLKVGTLRLDPGSTKNDDGRIVYLTPELKSLLTEQLARVDALARALGRIIPWVFPHLSGRRAGERRREFHKAWRTACRRAGVPGHLLHDFRRTAVRNMERKGVSRSVAMKITGHRTESVYRRYAIVSDADLREATAKLTGTVSGTGASERVESRRGSVQNDSHGA